MPDLGLYQGKYALRRVLDRIPGIARFRPNAVSLASLIPSALAGISIAMGWWPLAILGIAGRMVLTTLDGHIAENYGKKTRIGGYVNRVPAEDQPTRGLRVDRRRRIGGGGRVRHRVHRDRRRRRRAA